MSIPKPPRANSVDALGDFYAQAVLDASPDELRAEAIAMGEDPNAIIAEAKAAFRSALARCAVTADNWPDAADAPGSPRRAADAAPAPFGPGVDGRAPEAPDPFSRFDARGLRAVAAAFGCNMNFIGRLKDRLVRAEDMSAGFIRALAASLGTGTDALLRFLEGPARVPSSARFKSDGKPTAADKQSLSEALDASGLTDEQKRRLRSL